ncbi:MAG TPA: type II toxin-antitoxin system VapC family toxin [Archaeoglobaceae archaeon]|nr:type II toxin-antitoxin system VapC family toxin [Archaeoglobaceae archaeon]
MFISVKNREEDCNYCEKILDSIDDRKLEGIISTIVVAEVLVGFYQNKEVQEGEKFMMHVLQKYKVIPVGIEISNKAAKLRSESNIKLPDAIVAVTAFDADFLITKDDDIKRKIKSAIMPKEFVVKHLQ